MYILRTPELAIRPRGLTIASFQWARYPLLDSCGIGLNISRSWLFATKV